MQKCRSQRPLGLRCRSSAARLLRLCVRIPLGEWMFVCCECCVLRQTDHASRGVLPTVARRCVWSRNLEHEDAKARYRTVKIQPQWVVTPGKQTNKQNEMQKFVLLRNLGQSFCLYKLLPYAQRFLPHAPLPGRRSLPAFYRMGRSLCRPTNASIKGFSIWICNKLLFVFAFCLPLEWNRPRPRLSVAHRMDSVP
jgi:hypothetical protein